MLLTVQDMGGCGEVQTGMLRALGACWQQKPEHSGDPLSAQDMVLIVPVKPDHVQRIRKRKQSSITSVNGMLDIAMACL